MKLSMVLFALASQTQAMRLCNFFCPMMLDEVCGTDGQTYGKSGFVSHKTRAPTYVLRQAMIVHVRLFDFEKRFEKVYSLNISLRQSMHA